MRFYSKKENGFYDNTIHETLPDDAVEITDNEYVELLDGQASGKIIIADDYNNPILIDRPAPSNDELATQARYQRNKLLSECDWTQLPDNKADKAWKVYRQALRDITSQEGFPSNIDWPVSP